jgi:hypothetical protein
MIRRRGPKSLFAVFRVGTGDKVRIRRAIAYCQAAHPEWRAGDVLLRALENLGRSARVQLRRRGQDPAQVLAARGLQPKPEPAPFDGPPEHVGRIYENGERVGWIDRRVAPQKRGREYG